MVESEVAEAQEVKAVEERSTGVAAFFDLDGTLACLPSLEKRFFRMLRYRKFIGFRNYFLWLAEAVRLIPRGINQVMYANKMYLRGRRVDGGTVVPIRLRAAIRAEGKKVEDEVRGEAGVPVPLFAEGVERVAWHAERGHLLVIVSGTLEFLAERAARALEAELGVRGWTNKIRVCATRLEVKDERWTGRIAGEAMFGEAKARAIRLIATAENLDLRRSFGYGDSASDKWMLESVGKPAAVNPSNDLARIARRNDWAVLWWGKDKTSTERTPRAQKSQRTDQSDRELQVARAKAGFRT